MTKYYLPFALAALLLCAAGAARAKMNKHLLWLLLPVWMFLCGGVQAQTLVWQKINDLPNDIVYCMAVHDSFIYVSTYDSGMYRSSINGGHWVHLSNGLPNILIICITFNGDYIYVGTGDTNGKGKGIYRSTNKGDTWTQINNGLPVNVGVPSILVNGETIFSATWVHGIFRTTNNGDSWIQINNKLKDSTISPFLKCSNSILAGNWGKNIYKSIDNGEKWIKIKWGLKDTSISEVVVNDSIIFSETYNTANDLFNIYRSFDMGHKWIKVNKGLLKYRYIWDYATSGKDLFSSLDSKGIYHLPINGTTWKKLTNIGLKDQFVSKLAINNLIIYALTIDGVYSAELSALN